MDSGEQAAPDAARRSEREIAEWAAAYERVVELVRDLDADQVARQVPACPDWDVRALLSHMIGLDADVLGGDEPDDHNSAWTQGHVERRRGRTVPELLAEWAEVAPRLESWMAAHHTRPLGDIVIHEQDLRGALGRPGGRDTAGLAAVRDRMLGRFVERWGEKPTLGLVGEDWSWCSTGDIAPDAADIVVTASDFDLARALMSRRSADQLRPWTSVGELGDAVEAFAVLGPLPDRPLTD